MIIQLKCISKYCIKLQSTFGVIQNTVKSNEKRRGGSVSYKPSATSVMKATEFRHKSPQSEEAVPK